MSERGSFVTEYIYCARCMAVASSVLLGHEKHLCSTFVPSWELGKLLPIIAGKMGGSYAGEELNNFEIDYAPELAARICHPLRVAVLGESGEQIFTIQPEKEPTA